MKGVALATQGATLLALAGEELAAVQDETLDAAESAWAQLGLENEEAKKMLSNNKIPYVMNACLRVVHKLL